MERVPDQTIQSKYLQKSFLLPARVLWLIGSLIALGLFLAGLPQRAEEIKDLYQGNILSYLTQNQTGEIVLSPWPGSSAARAGVLEDDVLLAVDNILITSTEQATPLLAGAIGTPVTLRVRTGDFPPRSCG